MSSQRVELCDDDGGAASASVDTTGEHMLFHTRQPAGYELLHPPAVSIEDADVAVSFELQTRLRVSGRHRPTKRQ